MPRCDRISYEKLFDGKPPAAYDELTESGGYAVLVPENEYCFAGESEQISAGDKIWLAAAVSFIAALCSSLIPLADMQKKSLVDLIRTVD